jgi:glycosyltransferase involved in cell wall biosynthesis
MKPLRVSIVVCTHDRRGLLARLLASLADAAVPRGAAVEVLVIANACSDDTPRVLADAEAPLAVKGLRLRWAEEPVRGKSHALNLALTMLEGDAAAFIDDDHRVDPGFLVNIEKALRKHPTVNLLCGRILPDWDGREPAWVHDQGPYRLYPPPVPLFDAGDEERFLETEEFKPGGGNLIFRLPLLKTLGRFSSELGPRGHDLAGGEDSEFLQRALDRGERLLYLPNILQFHHVDLARLRLSKLVRLSYQRSRASARIHAGDGSGVPLFLWRKLARYLLSASLSLTMRRRRFYLVRSAAALGEIRGIAESRDPLLGA